MTCSKVLICRGRQSLRFPVAAFSRHGVFPSRRFPVAAIQGHASDNEVALQAFCVDPQSPDFVDDRILSMTRAE